MNKLLLPKGFKNITSLEEKLHTRPEKDWSKMGEMRALKLFHAMAERVPAYKDFLKKNSFKPDYVKSIKDFGKIPPIDKDNYLRAYTLPMLCWDGEFKDKPWTISTTSGSTGEPFYFPRNESQDWQYAISAELYLRSNFDIQNKSTLYIVAFPMGAWIGGLFTYEALKIIAETRNYNLSIITPGVHKKEVIAAVKQLGGQFDQVIIGSYAPFLKDILDDGEREGIRWGDYNLGFIFSAEAFSETFRDYVIEKAGLKDPLRRTLNHYGTVDLGTMAHETPVSILLRRELIKNPVAYEKIFNREKRLPTVAQYNPALFYFEDIEGVLHCSAFSGLPLVRYDLKDSGSIVSSKDLNEQLKSVNIDLSSLSKKAGISDTVWNLPYVCVYERNDFSVSFYAFQIYPEMIRRPLQDKSLDQFVTGKFTMLVDYDETGQQNLEINIELKADVIETEKLHNHLKSMLVEALLTDSSEYRETHKQYGEKVHPIIILWPYEDETYFKAGVKQKWVKK